MSNLHLRIVPQVSYDVQLNAETLLILRKYLVFARDHSSPDPALDALLEPINATVKRLHEEQGFLGSLIEEKVVQLLIEPDEKEKAPDDILSLEEGDAQGEGPESSEKTGGNE